MEKVLWMVEYVKSGLRNFVPQISNWIMFYWRVDHFSFALVSLFNSVSTFMGNLMPKPNLLKNSSGTI